MSVDHYENFPVASVLLPPRLRYPVGVIYRFARSADDFADEGDLPPAERLALLDGYRQSLKGIAAGQATDDALFRAVAGIVAEHRLPLQLFHDLLDAFSQDVTKGRYADFAELLDYSRRSANPVGRLLLHLFGATGGDNLQRSDEICSALQLINFWQDVAIDWKKDRVYLPQDTLARFGVTEEQIARGDTGGKWRDMLSFEVERARAMIKSGSPLATRLPGRIGLELRLVVQGGLRVLEKIEAVQCDVFRRRPVLQPLDWPLMFARALAM